MLIFNTDCSCGQIQTPLQSPQSQYRASSVCRGERHLFALSTEKPTSKVQVSCWWLLAQVPAEEPPPSEPRRWVRAPGDCVLTSPYMARYRSADQQEWFHFPAADSVIILRSLERTLWLWIRGLRCSALSLSRGRRNCAFGRGKWSDAREKRTNSLRCKQTAGSGPAPRRARQIRREARPARLLRRSAEPSAQEEGSACCKADKPRLRRFRISSQVQLWVSCVTLR